MNYIIKAMAKEAGYDPNSYDPFGLFNVEEFANIIIKECVDWCNYHAEDNGTAQKIIADIRSHFGVDK